MFEPGLLVSFSAVADAGSFTEAGRRLGLRQSTVSQHVRRLEESVGRRLFLRDTHSVRLTADGEAMLGHARSILEAIARAQRHFAAAPLRGRIRLGAAEDVVQTRLPEVLGRFRRVHPSVEIELTVALSGVLFGLMDAGRLDLVLGKRRPGGDRGTLLRREPLVWAALEGTVVDPERPLPLVLYPDPSISRAITLDALAAAGRAWRIACTGSSLSGLRAAALAGLGVTVQVRGMLAPGLVELPPGPGLPCLGEIDLVLTSAASAPREPAAELVQALMRDALAPGDGAARH